MIPGEYFLSAEPITANVGKSTTSLSVKNTGDRPIQVGSHTHFFEANKALDFPREKSYGCRLNIPAGTSVRFEPGETREIELTEFGGKKIVYGFSGLVNGSLEEKQKDAFNKASEKGFKGLSL
jgi:urease subunit beta